MRKNYQHDPIRSDASTHPYLRLNPRGVRKAPRKEVSYDGKPTLMHLPASRSPARRDPSRLFDRKEVWYCRNRNCLVVKSIA